MTTEHGFQPTGHASELLTQQIGLETLVYNERTHQAFCLNPIAAEVFKRFDGVQTPAQISMAASIALGAPVTEEAVLFAVAELRGKGLIAPAAVSAPLAVSAPSTTRRDLMRQMGAGAIVMLPAVAVIMAPRAAQAYNGCVNCDAQHANSGAAARRSRSSDSQNSDSGSGRKKDGDIFVP